MKKYIRATAALSALVCGVSLLTFVPAALAQAPAPFSRGDNELREVCINGMTRMIKGRGADAAIAANGGPNATNFRGPCQVSPP